MTTCVFGKRATICCVASMPPSPGMRMSISTTSGCNRSTARTASAVVPASPTTCMLGWSLMSVISPSRTTS